MLHGLLRISVKSARVCAPHRHLRSNQLVHMSIRVQAIVGGESAGETASRVCAPPQESCTVGRDPLATCPETRNHIPYTINQTIYHEPSTKPPPPRCSPRTVRGEQRLRATPAIMHRQERYRGTSLTRKRPTP